MVDNVSDILIVDDDEDTCLVLSDVLTDCGYRVEIALNGDAALAMAERKSFRLAVLDFWMPGTTGTELFPRLRQLRNGMAGIMITAFLTAEGEASAQAAGIQEILPKPLDVLQLLTFIQELLGQI
jgi:DNA-binding NtrC family response regulator